MVEVVRVVKVLWVVGVVEVVRMVEVIRVVEVVRVAKLVEVIRVVRLVMVVEVIRLVEVVRSQCWSPSIIINHNGFLVWGPKGPKNNKNNNFTLCMTMPQAAGKNENCNNALIRSVQRIHHFMDSDEMSLTVVSTKI